MDNYKYTCDLCKFKCNYNSAWLDHLSSEKHKRYGKPKTHKCKYENCNHETPISWNMKMHVMTMHSTKEERSKSKYYCEDCDKVYFSSIYYQSHLKGAKHLNQSKINEINKIQLLNNQDPNINL